MISIIFSGFLLLILYMTNIIYLYIPQLILKLLGQNKKPIKYILLCFVFSVHLFYTIFYTIYTIIGINPFPSFFAYYFSYSVIILSGWLIKSFITFLLFESIFLIRSKTENKYKNIIIIYTYIFALFSFVYFILKLRLIPEFLYVYINIFYITVEILYFALCALVLYVLIRFFIKSFNGFKIYLKKHYLAITFFSIWLILLLLNMYVVTGNIILNIFIIIYEFMFIVLLLILNIKNKNIMKNEST